MQCRASNLFLLALKEMNVAQLAQRFADNPLLRPGNIRPSRGSRASARPRRLVLGWMELWLQLAEWPAYRAGLLSTPVLEAQARRARIVQE